MSEFIWIEKVIPDHIRIGQQHPFMHPNRLQGMILSTRIRWLCEKINMIYAGNLGKCFLCNYKFVMLKVLNKTNETLINLVHVGYEIDKLQVQYFDINS